MKTPASMSQKEMAQIRQNLEGTPDIEEAAELMNLAGNSTRLKLLYLLDNMKELKAKEVLANAADDSLKKLYDLERVVDVSGG